MYGRKVKIGAITEIPDDKTILDTHFENEAQAEEALKSTSFAQMVTTRRGGHVESVVYMDEDELLRHIFEARSVLKAMREFAKLADREWSRYHKGRRKKKDVQD